MSPGPRFVVRARPGSHPPAYRLVDLHRPLHPMGEGVGFYGWSRLTATAARLNAQWDALPPGVAFDP